MVKFILKDSFKTDYDNSKARIEAVDMAKINEAEQYALSSGNELLINAMADMKSKALEPIRADIDFVEDADSFISKYVDTEEISESVVEVVEENAVFQSEQI